MYAFLESQKERRRRKGQKANLRKEWLRTSQTWGDLDMQVHEIQNHFVLVTLK